MIEPLGEPPPHAASRRIARNAIIRSVGDVVAKAASIVFFVAVARELGTDGFGHFTFALALGALLSAPAGFGTDGLVTREVARDSERVHDYLPNVIAIKAVTSVGLLAVAVGVGAVAGSSTERLAAVVLVGSGVALENVARSCYAAFQGYERMEFAALSAILQRVVTTAVAVVVLAAGGGVVAVSLVYACGAVLAFLLALWALRRYVVHVRWRVHRERWRPIVLQGIPIGIATVFFAVLLALDSVLLGLLRESGDVGVYGAAFRLVETTMFVSWSLGGAMLPWFARQQESDPRATARGYEFGLKALVAILAPVAVVLGLLAPEVVELLYGEDYAEAVDPLRVLAALTILYGVSYFTGASLTARDRPEAFARAAGAALVVNVATNLVLIPAYGPIGAAVAAVVSAAVLVLLIGRAFVQVAGAVKLLRIGAGPAAGALAMAAVLLLLDLPLAVSLVLGGVAYLAGLVAFELVAWRDDARLARSALLSRRPSTVSADRRGRRPLVLGYHGIADVPLEHDPHNLMISPAAFRAQMEWLQERSYEFLTVSEFVRRLLAGESLRGCCALTFDDGSEDGASTLPALLEELGIVGTLYVCPGLLGRPHPFLRPESGVRILTREELVEVSRLPVFEIGSHTNLHDDLANATAEDAYRELASSKEALEDLIGRPVETFAYPFCRYSPACPAAAERAGYSSAVTCEGRGGLVPFELGREAVSRLDGRLALALRRRGVYDSVFDSAPGRLFRGATRPVRTARRAARVRRDRSS